jgi:hypothetical protein
MEMEKSYYVLTYQSPYLELLRASPGTLNEEPAAQRLILAITQGGFGQDIVDDERQTKERFLEHLFVTTGIDMPRTAETFDQYFALERADDFIDLDVEML